MDSADTLLLYRFDTGRTVYGPKPLKWFAEVYGRQSNCWARLADALESSESWLPAPEWEARYKVSPADTTQLEKLRKLKALFDPSTITVAEATILIRSSEGAKPATPAARKKAAALGLVFPPDISRGALRDLVDEAERVADVAKLRAQGALIPDTTPGTVIQEYRDALESAAFGIEQAKERGLVISLPEEHTLAEVQALAADLDEFWSAAGDMLDVFREMRDEERIPRLPSRSAAKASLPYLLELIRTKRWGTAAGSFLDVAQHALNLDGYPTAGQPPHEADVLGHRFVNCMHTQPSARRLAPTSLGAQLMRDR